METFGKALVLQGGERSAEEGNAELAAVAVAAEQGVPAVGLEEGLGIRIVAEDQTGPAVVIFGESCVRMALAGSEIAQAYDFQRA